MGKLADALKERRQSRQRRLGFGAPAQERPPQMLLGTVGVVDGADFCLALTESEAAAAAESDAALWGARLVVLTPESAATAKAAGASFVSFVLDDARADAMLDEEIDYIVRLLDVGFDESAARALGSLQPAMIGLEALDLPLSVTDIIQLRRLAMFAAAPICVTTPSHISAGDIQALRDSGAAALLLAEGATAEDAAAVKQRIADLPERKSRRDDEARPLIPTISPSAADDD